MIDGIHSMELFDRKGKSVIAENKCDSTTLVNMEFTMQILPEGKKKYDKLADMLMSSVVELANAVGKLFHYGGCIHFLREDGYKYIGTAKNIEEYKKFDTFSLVQIACDKDDKIIDLYTMNPILIDGKIQYFKL